MQHQVSIIQQSDDYPKQPAVQAATVLLETDATSLEAMVAQISSLHAQLTALEAARDTKAARVQLDRRNVEAAITIACGGDPTLIASYGCTPQVRTSSPASTVPPTGLTAKTSKDVPGTVTLKCKKVPGAGSYLFRVGTDPAAAPGAGTPLLSLKTSLVLTGQPVGHILYVRAAVVRRNGGESLWTDVIQITVR